MVAQRGHGVVAPAAEKPVQRREKPAPRARVPRQKLTFADQHKLKMLPTQIEALSGQARDLEAKLSAADFYGRDPAGFAAASSDLERVRRELAAAEDEWLRIELLREEIESA
jgi:ATP-binding cassette subfamily F protein uup